MSNTTTIEAIDLADYDWTPCCDVYSVTTNPDGSTVKEDPCGQPAAFVIEVRHCTPYRLFACVGCVQGRAPNGWLCRKCDGSCPPPFVIGHAS